MKLPGRRRQSRRGTTFVEVMVAGLLLSIGVMALVHVWAFSYNVTVNTDDKNAAYNLARRAMEKIKRDFMVARYEPSTMVGTVTEYYSGAHVKLAGSSGSRFTVVRTITSDNALPPLYTATVRVTITGSTTVQYHSGTYLVKGGI
jgi:Tfp pilus assembly protein PilV